MRVRRKGHNKRYPTELWRVDPGYLNGDKHRNRTNLDTCLLALNALRLAVAITASHVARLTVTALSGVCLWPPLSKRTRTQFSMSSFQCGQCLQSKTYQI